jgi:hypothetical protein
MKPGAFIFKVFYGCLTRKMETQKIPQNIGNHSPVSTAERQR